MAMNAHTHLLARRNATALAVLASLAVASAGCGGGGGSSSGTATTAGSKQSSADFIREVTTEFSRGQAGRLWDTLHPADQAIVTRARYTACQTNSGFDLKRFKVLETYPDTVDIAGTPTPSTAVSVQVTSDDGVTTATMHAIKVNGAWRWILSPTDYAAYKLGKCPTG
jgi:hypothetical protein